MALAVPSDLSEAHSAESVQRAVEGPQRRGVLNDRHSADRRIDAPFMADCIGLRWCLQSTGG
jgi:hypothetical protein